MGPPGGGAPPPCLAEFLRLREDVDKKGRTAKAASEHKATREEMCKHITAYAAAELKWVKFTEANTAACGIPPRSGRNSSRSITAPKRPRQRSVLPQWRGQWPARAYPTHSVLRGSLRRPRRVPEAVRLTR